MNRIICFILFTIYFSIGIYTFCQSKHLSTFKLDQTTYSHGLLPPSNSISQIQIVDSTIWIGTSKGLAKSTNYGKSWISFRNDQSFANEGIYALSANNQIIWASTGYNKEIEEGTIQTGSGYSYSTDAGNNWTFVAQPLDTCIEISTSSGKRVCQKYIPFQYGINDSVNVTAVTTTVANVTFDLSLSSGTVWIASWSSGLRKSTNYGISWENILLPLDSQDKISLTDSLWYFASSDTLRKDTLFHTFDVVLNDNLKAFSVLAINNDTIWCGTAGGVNRSTDGGESWLKFSHQNQKQGAPILGNWVIAIKEQRFRDVRRIWITNWKATDPDEDYGVSYTENDGKTWKNLLRGTKAYDFTFKDSISYIATEDGVYRTNDGGLSFTLFNTFNNLASRQIISSQSVFAIGVLKDTIFVGTSDGLASTIDDSSHQFGMNWNIYRTYSITAYPNPFSQSIDRVIKIRYSQKMSNTSNQQSRNVSIDIFDFGLNRVRSIIHNATRTAIEEPEERWDGKNDNGEPVASGVYFYRVKIDDNTPIFGKILMLP